MGRILSWRSTNYMYYSYSLIMIVNNCDVSTFFLCDQISRAEGNVAVFKSTFFGTFGSDALFSPPTPINFVEIFLNFSEKLKQTPQVLGAEVFLIIFFIAIVIPLRRADQKDRLLVSQSLHYYTSIDFQLYNMEVRVF